MRIPGYIQWEQVHIDRVGRIHKCRICSHSGNQFTKLAYRAGRVHKCKIRSNSGTRVTNQHIGQEDVHKCRSHSWTRVTNQHIRQEDVHKCSHSGNKFTKPLVCEPVPTVLQHHSAGRCSQLKNMLTQ